MKSLFKYCIIFLLFLIYIYSIIFKAIPISSKLFVYAMGFLYVLPILFSKHYRLKREYTGLLRLAGVIVFWDLLVCSFNTHFEMYLTKGVIGVIASFFGANLLYEISKSHISSKMAFLNVVVITIAIQSLLAIIMKFVPPIFSFFDSIQEFLIPREDVGDDLALMERFVGLGTGVYFSALLPCALGVMTLIYLMAFAKSSSRIVLYIIMYIVIAIFTFFTARTSAIIVALSLFFLLFYQRRISFLIKIKTLVIIFIVVIFAYSLIAEYVDVKTIRWAMRVFEDRDSGSAGLVKEWWLNTEFSLKTLLIGDGYYSLGLNSYYMGIDIGFHRKVFYGGLIGLLLELIFHIKALNYIYGYERTRETKLLVVSLFLSYLIIIGKGDASMMSLFVLYLVFYSKGIFEKKMVTTK